ncbi:MAG: HTH-type transcriptional regulator GltR [Pseudomonadota bacterium]
MKLPQEFDLHALEVFVMTVELGGIELGGMSQCASHLQVTQSAVSQTIAKLEAGIGASLFDRTMRPLGLTASGKSLFARGQKLIAHASAKAQTCRYPALRSRCRSALPTN